MIANCLKNDPCRPVMKAVGRKTPMRTREIASSAPPTSSMVLCAASFGVIALLDVALDVFDDDDGVVDDDTDREHEAEQRQRVERDADQAHDEERADQRHGDGQDRDDRGAPRLQEQDDDEDDEHERFDQRVDHGVDRELDELGRIVDDRVADTRREVLFQSAPSRALTAAAVASALEPGFWKMTRAVAVLLSR